MKKKSIIKYIIPILMIVFAVTAWFGVKQATAAIQRLEKIEAYYTGVAVEVGKEIDLKDISVTAEEIEAEYEKIAAGAGVSVEEVKKHYEDPRSKEYLEDDAKEQKLYTMLFEQVKVSKGEKTTFAELFKPAN